MDKNINNLKIAVLAGGVGSEREVSLQSGENIYRALKYSGSDVILSDITPDNMGILDDPSINVFFLALHGQFGEDGQLQKVLEEKQLCFTGSGSASSQKSFDKLRSKQAFFHANLPIAKHLIVHEKDTEAELETMLTNLGSKFVVKPVCQGSSVGVEIVDDVKTAASKAVECFNTYGDCMVEEFIAGREITVGILNGAPLPIVEIKVKSAFYDYHTKYLDDSTEYLFDTIDDADLIERIQKIAVICFNELECRHLSRVDMILTDTGIPYILEINTLPGFTSHSLLPMAAEKAGIPAAMLCRKIVETAWNDFKK